MKRRIVSASLLVPLVMLVTAFGSAGAATAHSDDGDDGSGFEGVIQALPPSGLVGDWLVSGTAVHVGISTEIETDDGPVMIGAFVEVEGVTGSDGSITASKVEVDDGDDDEDGDDDGDDGRLELHGTIVLLPTSLDLVGTWNVSGLMVLVTTATELDDEGGGFAVGMRVEVRATIDINGLITASKVEADDAEDCDDEDGDDIALSSGSDDDEDCDDEDGDDIALIGTLQLRGSNPGMWRVSQNRVRVTAATTIIRNGHRLIRGADLRIKGLWRANGTIRATRIMVLR